MARPDGRIAAIPDASITASPEVPIARAPARPFFERPFAWLLFASALLLVPIVGYLGKSHMSWEEIHPAINAMLNGASALFLVIGFVAIKRHNVPLHKQCMLAAFVASSVFLASYLVRFYISGTHRYPSDGIDKIVYLVILFSHMALAVAVVPLVLRSLFLAWRKRFPEHRKIVKFTWPIWIYVSVTGVVVYLMLYPIAGALYGH